MNEHVYQDHQNNAIRISRFDSFAGEVTFSNVAAKFVVSGTEMYVLHGKKFLVNKGEYVIGNNNRLTEVLIEQNTLGLCIDISNQCISDIIDYNFQNPDLKEFILSDKFLINKYSVQNTSLGQRLNSLSTNLLLDKKGLFLTQELFYQIGENIVNDQAVIFEQYAKLRYKKQVVHDEVFRNLLHTKDYIDQQFLTAIQLDDLIRVAFVSRYAFIRLFKTAFGITPYQYILQKRLFYAKSMLLQGEKVVNVASATCFADTPSFSKAFKKLFRMSPTVFVK